MALLDDILNWSNDLPAWQRDALRRIFSTNSQLTAKDLAEIQAMLEGSINAPKPVPLAKSHIPTMGSGTSTILLRLSNLNNVNGFTNGREISMADKGITVIFGENGAGKSGFSRVMKRACRARHSTQVLANAFAKESPDATITPEATFTYVSGGITHSNIWTEGCTSNSDLAMVSVYDSQCAQDYITNDGPSTFVPYGLHSLSWLATAQQSIQEELSSEISAIRLQADQFAALHGTHAVGKVMAQLGPHTDIAALEVLAKLTPQEIESIKELSAAIKGLDVEPEARKHELLAQRLDNLANLAINAERFVTEAALDKFSNLAQTEDTAIEADRLAQGLLHGDGSPSPQSDLLPKTGGAEWKILFKAAQTFSLKAHPDHPQHPPNGPDDQCVLCQQPLDVDAQIRMDRFREFIAADAAMNLETARKAVVEARQKIDVANLAPVDEPTLAEIRQSENSLADMVVAHQATWTSRREWVQTSYMLSNWSEPRPPLLEGSTLSMLLSAKAKDLRQLATQLRRAKNQKEHDTLKAQLAELTSRSDLETHLPAIRVYISEASFRASAVAVL